MSLLERILCLFREHEWRYKHSWREIDLLCAEKYPTVFIGQHGYGTSEYHDYMNYGIHLFHLLVCDRCGKERDIFGWRDTVEIDRPLRSIEEMKETGKEGREIARKILAEKGVKIEA